ncbi:hypothetical protein [Streptomyces virginiae]|uniref:hypothetical protein n=1 Tax=Streptomyces virginiae TaxID=1961 RepID=UPI003677CACB
MTTLVTRTVRLGTRPSPMALEQTGRFADTFRTRHPGVTLDILKITSEGDAHRGPLSQIGGKGAFTRRADEHLLDGRVTATIACAKDLPRPHDRAPGMTVGAVLAREDARDVLVFPVKSVCSDLEGARRRRQCVWRPGCEGAPSVAFGQRGCKLLGRSVTDVHRCRCLGMTDFMVKIPSDWLARVFLSLRHSSSEEAQAVAAELQPFTEKPGQRVPVPRATVLRSELALRVEIEWVDEPGRRARLSEEAEQLISARLGGLGS